MLKIHTVLSKKYRKLFSKKFIIFLVFSFFIVSIVNAADLTSTNFIIKDPIIGTGGGYGSSTNFELISAGNSLLSGVGSSSSFKGHYGFLYYEDRPHTITFDIDTASDFSNGESSAPYTVALGALSTAGVTHSDTSSVRMIVAEGDSSDSVIVTVQNANGTNGLVSTSSPSDNINSTTGTMAAGTENYGLCVATAGLTGFSRSSGYSSDSCSTGSSSNGVQGLSSTPTSILNSGGSPLTNGHAEIIVNAAISDTTPAHPDYSDTLTFVATATF